MNFLKVSFIAKQSTLRHTYNVDVYRTVVRRRAAIRPQQNRRNSV